MGTGGARGIAGTGASSARHRRYAAIPPICIEAEWHTARMGRHDGAVDWSDAVVEHSRRSFHHETLFYAGEGGFLKGTLPFIKEALAAEEPVLVAVGSAKIALLEEALGKDAERVRFTDMHILGRNPARIIPAWRQFLEDHASDGGPVRGIGEPIWPGRSRAELTECQRHESLLNLAFDEGQAWQLLCPYDLEALDQQIIEAAQRSHPFIAQEGASRISDTYLPAYEAPGPFTGELPSPSTQPEELTFTGEALGALRRFVSQRAADASLDANRTEDLVLAVNELATNSVYHGGGRGTLRIWRETQTLLCEVRDRSHITEPLVGRIRPTPDQPAGRGLWLVNHLCDLVQIRSSPNGSVVRVHMRLA
jgi:anti-sigma regulatory factor (Ser/Thr protein kinase)